MPSGGMQVIQACHKVVKHVLAVADPTWYAAVKAAKMAAQMDDALLHYDDIELDKLGVSEDSPLSTSDAMPRNGRLGILKEEEAQWILQHARDMADYDPSGAGGDVLQIDLDCLKDIWQHEYCEEMMARQQGQLGGKWLSYGAFRKVWSQVEDGTWCPGWPKVVMRKFKRNAGLCSDCVAIRQWRMGCGNNMQRHEECKRAHKLHKAAHTLERHIFYDRRAEACNRR
eukprot:jgi/Mesvir1/14557/Mv05239-RA.1